MSEQFREAIERIATAPRAPYATIRVERITPIIGAHVTGIDLSQPLVPESLAEVRRALLENHVLVFPDQAIDVAAQKAFGRCFGALRRLPPGSYDGDDPEIVPIRAGKGSKFVAGEQWHADGTADPAPSLGSMLYMDETPEIGVGGDTLFANMHLAYDLLSPPMRAMLDGLTAIHDGAVPWKGYDAPPGLPRTEHPIVVRHPETGRRFLFVNSGFTTRIPQLSEAESTAVLGMLFGLVEHEQALNCRVRWHPGTLVFWDNRCTQHRAIWDYYPYSRLGRRVTILGTPPAA